VVPFSPEKAVVILRMLAKQTQGKRLGSLLLHISWTALLFKIRQDDKYNFFLVRSLRAAERLSEWVGEATFNFAISRFGIIFHGNATV
jgi:hypothetical protein